MKYDLKSGWLNNILHETERLDRRAEAAETLGLKILAEDLRDIASRVRVNAKELRK